MSEAPAVTDAATADNDASELTASAEAVFDSVDDLLAHARQSLRRLDAQHTVDAIAAGARLVDIRPSWQRAQGRAR